ncbi:hypothetical protein TNCV_5122091 [Trichonephila clavipes]|nr:hypothetical protein TNCV_5122091 [Trichonephila clavipes]
MSFRWCGSLDIQGYELRCRLRHLTRFKIMRFVTKIPSVTELSEGYIHTWNHFIDSSTKKRIVLRKDGDFCLGANAPVEENEYICQWHLTVQEP